MNRNISEYLAPLKWVFFIKKRVLHYVFNFQKQSFADVLQNRCSWKFRKFHRKTLVSESPFNKVAGLEACDFVKKRLWHKYFPVKFAKFLRTPFFTEHFRWLLLNFNRFYFFNEAFRFSLKIKSGNYIWVESYADGRQYTGTWNTYLLHISKWLLLNFFQNLKNIYLSNFNESKLRKWLEILNNFCHSLTDVALV